MAPPPVKVLIVDDEPHIRRLLATTLARAGYATIEAGGARQVMPLVAGERPDVVLLDLGLPDRDGLELVSLIRREGDTAVLVISARDTTEDKVAALDLGAIDYVTKPFDTDELLARIRVALRSRLVAAGGRAEVAGAGGVLIDLVGRRVRKGSAAVHLTPKEYGVVAELARFPGRVITHQKLLAAVWPNDDERHVEYLRVVVRNIRQKLEDDPVRPALLVNELGVGYRLMGAAG